MTTPPVYLLVVSLGLLAGCAAEAVSPSLSDASADAAVTDTAGAWDADALWRALETCGLTGRFTWVTASELPYEDRQRCGMPFMDEDERVVLVDRSDLGAPRLRVGNRALTVTDALEGCRFQARTCGGDTDLGYARTLTATFGAGGSGLDITFEATGYKSFRPITCPTMTVDAKPLAAGACLIPGTYELEGDATLVSGSCDLTWKQMPVVVRKKEDLYGDLVWVLSWVWGVESFATDDYDVRAMDEDTCTVEAATGTYIFNGVPRTIAFRGSIQGDRLELTISDDMEGRDAMGNTCEEATFQVAGVRKLPPEDLLPTTCEPLAYVCGDGTCAAADGETCDGCPEDCGCTEGSCEAIRPDPSKGITYACIIPCEGLQDTSCGAGRRCLKGDEIGSGEAWVCLDSPGTVARGGACDTSALCSGEDLCVDGVCRAPCDPSASGSECAPCRSYADGIGGCVAVCSPESPDACGPGGRCVATTSHTQCGFRGDDPYTCFASELDYACQPSVSVPGFGDPCTPEEGCEVGSQCLGEGCVDTGGHHFECSVYRCTRTCASDADCAAPLSRCWDFTYTPENLCVSDAYITHW